MRNGLLTSRVRLSLILAVGVGLVAVAILPGCGNKDQDNDAAKHKPQAMLPESQLETAAGDTSLAHQQNTVSGTGTLPGAEGVSGTPAAAGQDVPAAGAELKAAPKEIEAAPLAAGARPATSVSSGGSGFSLQLGSFTNLANAQNQLDRISALGYNPVIEQSDLGGQTYHRVMLKGVGDMDEASRLGEYIHSELGIAYLVRRGQ
jgi:cell division septation protein DedD